MGGQLERGIMLKKDYYNGEGDIYRDKGGNGMFMSNIHNDVFSWACEIIMFTLW